MIQGNSLKSYCGIFFIFYLFFSSSFYKICVRSLYFDILRGVLLQEQRPQKDHGRYFGLTEMLLFWL